jgi:hypothetical protein
MTKRNVIVEILAKQFRLHKRGSRLELFVVESIH